MLSGRTPEQKRLLIERLTSAVSDTLTIDPSRVSVLIIEHAAENWGKSGIPLADAAGTMDGGA
jgi:4-oxalocrotonate tautomerase family enzyme